MKIKVGVIFGGESVEHEISIISALQMMDNIDKSIYEVIPIYISKERIWYYGDNLLDINNYKYIDILINKCKEVVLTKKDNEFVIINKNCLFNKVLKKIDIAFPIVHGANVEDGTLQGYLDTIGIPYVGSKVLGASISQDKVIIKSILKSNNINVVDYIWFYDYEFIDNQNDILNKVKILGYPVIVKPATLGSSVGINYVKNELTIEDAINEAIMYDKKIIIEKSVDNLIEVNCSVIGDYLNSEASVLEEVVSDNSILTYNDKYIGNNKSKGIVNTKRIIPANIDNDLISQIQNISKKVFKVLNLSGVVRIDYLVNSKTKEYYVNEPNTIPGSLSYYLWEKSNKDYKYLINELINISIKEYNNSKKKISSFETNILNNVNGVKK